MKTKSEIVKDTQKSASDKKIIGQLADDRPRIIPIPGSTFRTNNSIIIAGFPSPGMIGSIVCNQLIEQLDLHQVAYVHSKYVAPGVIWVGGKLRYPFRVYSNLDNSVFVLICDVPVAIEGIDSITSAITNWSHENKIEKIFIVSGIYPDNMNPFPKNLTNRKAFFIENDQIFKPNIDDISKFNTGELPQFAFIGGLPGQILANCVVRSIHCLALLVPTFSFIPDPEGAALVIELLSNLIPKAKISSTQLRDEAEKVKTQLSHLGKLQQRLMKNVHDDNKAHEEIENMYK